MDRTEAVVLSVRPFRERDRMLTILTPSSGRRELLMRGGRKIASKLSPHTQPYTLVQVEMIHGRRFVHLTGAEVQSAFPHLHGRLSGLAQAGFVTEVATALASENEAAIRLYRLVGRELRRIERGTLALRPADALALSLFALRALAIAGWKLPFGRCVVCERSLGTVPAVFLPHPYGFAHARCRTGEGAVALHRTTRKFLYERLSRTTQPAVVPRGVAREVSAVAARALEAVLERPLASWRFLRSVAGSVPPPELVG